MVLLGAGCLAAASLAGMRGLTFDIDVLSLLPRDGRVVPAFRSFVASFGSVDDLYVVLTAPAGHDISEYEDDVDAWGDRLGKTPEIVRVDAGRADALRDLSWLADHQLLLLADVNLRRAISRFSGDGLVDALRDRRAMLAVPSPAIANMVRHDPLGLYDLLREQLGAAQAGINLGITEDGYVSSDLRSRLLIATPAQPPFDADFSGALMTSLEALRGELSERAAHTGATDPEEARPPLQVQFAGGHRIAVETASVIRRESIVNTVGSLALILPLLFLVFRSPWLVLVGSIPSALSLVVVLGMLGFAGATLTTAVTASSAMLFGLGVDGVVLLYAGYTVAVRNGAEPGVAIDSLGGPASSMLLGMWTTAATFYGLTFVDFPSLEQLGTLIGRSMVLCGILTLVLVPALLPRRRPSRPVRSLSMPRFAGWVDRRNRGILAVALVVTVLLAVAATRLRINPTLDQLRSVTPGAELLQRMGPMFGLPDDVYVVVASGTNLEALLESNERLHADLGRALPGMTVHAPTALLPSRATQVRRRALIHEGGLSASVTAAQLVAAERAEGFKPGSLDPFRERLPALLEPTDLTYEGYVTHGLPDLIGRFVARVDDGWLLATYAFPSRPEDVATLETRVRETDPTATLTGLPLVNRELADGFLPEFAKGLSIGSVIVVALVLVAFRDWRLSLLSLAPTAVGIVWAAGALALAGIPFDLFALFAVVTLVGIGVDYGVHVVHRYSERGDSRQAIEELAPVILVAAAVTLLGYGTLVASSYPPLRSIGLVSAVSIVMLAGASLFVLPALLSAFGTRRAA
jgi:predicted RND superfamily exporter protein